MDLQSIASSQPRRLRPDTMAAMRSTARRASPKATALGQVAGDKGFQGHQPIIGSFLELKELESLSLDLLRKRWRIVLGRAAPPQLPPKLMARILAWKMQVQEAGDLGTAHRELLDRAFFGRKESQPITAETPTQQPKALRTGTVLAREYAGVLHRVTVLPDGAFGWREKTYRSLSEVARAITGTNWNGPRFFGFKTKSKEQRHKGQSAEGALRGEEASS